MICPHCKKPITEKFGLTPKQAELLEFIEDCTENGCAPSYDEMALAMGVSSRSRIHWLVSQLEERGHVKKMYGRARSVVLT